MIELVLRLSLWISLPLNAGAAYILAFPSSWPGQLLGLPAAPDPVYAYLAAYLVALLGLAYGWMALQPSIVRPLLWLGALGKGGAFAVAAALWLAGLARAPLAAAVTVDLLLAAFWIAWLTGTRGKASADG
ncbi:MAG TPA: hypothetical protein VIS55_10015 [Pseudomonadales bacterium]|jgi:hypothetical protein